MKSKSIRLVFLLICILPFFHSPSVQAQKVYKAQVVDTLNKAVPDASVILKDKKSNIVSYDLTNSRGYFMLNIPEKYDTLYISIQKTGFKTLKKTLIRGFYPSKYILKAWVETLDDIVISGSAIRKKGDTVIYRAKSFLSQNDVVVEDLLRKLPGVTVSEDGTVSYEGKPVNHFFVENLDMTGGRYQRITRRLQADAIKSIEVIKNYNEIQALSQNHSDQVALNLILKNKFYKVLTINGELGEPLLSGLIEPDFMMFGKRRQTGINVNLNNTGQIHDDKILTLNLTEILAGFTSRDYRLDWVDSDENYSLPGHKKFVRMNLAGSWQSRADLSYLILTRSDNQFRINTYFSRKHIFLKNVRDYQFLSGLQIPETKETSQIKQSENTDELEMSYTVNKPEKYFKNVTRVQFSGENVINLFTHNQSVSFAGKQKPWFYFKNNLRTVHSFGKSRVETNQLLEINRSRQSYDLNPILFGNALFQPHDSVLQQVKYNLLSFNQYVKWHKPFQSVPGFSLPSIAYTFLQYDIATHMSVNGIMPDADSLRNDYRIRTQKFILKQSFEKRTGRFFVRLNLPLFFRSLMLVSKTTSIEKRKFRAEWYPGFFVEYNAKNFAHTFGFRYQKRWTELPQTLPGYVLVNRRRLQNGEVFFTEKSVWDFNLKFEHFNYQKAFDISLGLHYQFGTDMQIASYNLNAAGFYSTEYLNQKSPYAVKNLSIDFSKFFYEPKVSLKGTYLYTFLRNYQIRNGEKLPVFQNNQTAEFQIDSELGSYRFGMNFHYADYHMSFKNTNLTTRTFTLKTLLTKTFSRKFSLQAGIFYLKSASQTLHSDLMSSNLTFQWKPFDQSVIYLRANNLFNQNQYVIFSKDLYSVTVERYYLRPREIFLGVNWRL